MPEGNGFRGVQDLKAGEAGGGKVKKLEGWRGVRGMKNIKDCRILDHSRHIAHIERHIVSVAKVSTQTANYQLAFAATD